MRAAVAVEHGEVQQVVMDTGDTEAVLVLLPETQNGRRANPGQTDLREGGREGVNSFIRSFTHLFINPFICSFIHLLIYSPFNPFVSTLSRTDSSIHPVTCGMGFPYLILEGSSIGSSILLSQIPNESQVTGRPLLSLSKRTNPLARRTPTCGPK